MKEVLDEFDKFHLELFRFKEQFDKCQSGEDAQVHFHALKISFDILIKKVSLNFIFEDTDVSRHMSWLSKNIIRNQIRDSDGDVYNLIYDDLPKAKNYYYSYVTENFPAEISINWNIIHEKIKIHAKPRFDNRLYADSVEAAFKELNDIIKKQYKSDFKMEFDGDKLMREAFSANEEKLNKYLLADIKDRNGKDIQQGYMELFAGSIKGIRNPKAHQNIIIDVIDAWEKIILASHLMKMFDKRINKTTFPEIDF